MDPDASLYWLARMVYAGEDPRFIFRRLLILASEDVGLADPNALSVVLSCAQTFDRIGMPEGRYPLAQATLYLATAAKSNTTWPSSTPWPRWAKSARATCPTR